MRPGKGHPFEILSENTRNKRWRHEDHGHDGKNLDDLILFDIDQAHEDFLHVVETFETELGVVDQRG
jgi:hypothetical protein